MQQTEFTRKAKIGVNPLTIAEGETMFLHILSASPQVYVKNDGDTVDYVMATNMQSGEEGHFWLAGALKHQLAKLAKERGTIADLKIEVKHLGKQVVELDGEKRSVNQYDLYELN